MHGQRRNQTGNGQDEWRPGDGALDASAPAVKNSKVARNFLPARAAQKPLRSNFSSCFSRAENRAALPARGILRMTA